MTTRRLIASLMLSTVALAVAGVLAVRAFPLQANAAAPSSGGPVAIVKGGEHLLHGGLPEYPRRAIDQQVDGDVDLEVTLDDRGEVSDARVLSGPDELRKAALESVLNWHYSPAALRSSVVEGLLTHLLHLCLLRPGARTPWSGPVIGLGHSLGLISAVIAALRPDGGRQQFLRDAQESVAMTALGLAIGRKPWRPRFSLKVCPLSD